MNKLVSGTIVRFARPRNNFQIGSFRVLGTDIFKRYQLVRITDGKQIKASGKDLIEMNDWEAI